MPFKFPSALYIVIGLVVVFIKDYLDSLGTISRILTAILGVLLWPLLLLGIDLHVDP